MATGLTLCKDQANSIATSLTFWKKQSCFDAHTHDRVYMFASAGSVHMPDNMEMQSCFSDLGRNVLSLVTIFMVYVCVLHFWLSRLYWNLMWFHAMLWLCKFGSSLLDVELSVDLTIILCMFVFYWIYLWQCVALWFLELVWIELRMIHDKNGIELGGWASVCAAPVVRWHVANINSKLMSLRNHSTKSNVKRGPCMYLSCLICT